MGAKRIRFAPLFMRQLPQAEGSRTNDATVLAQSHLPHSTNYGVWNWAKPTVRLLVDPRKTGTTHCTGDPRGIWNQEILGRYLYPWSSVCLYSTLLPQAWAADWNRAVRVTGISPLRGSLGAARAGGSIIMYWRSYGKTACPLFLDRWVPLAALFGRLWCGKTAQAGLGAPSRVALRFSGASSGNVFQSPDVTGHGPVFFKVHRGHGTTPSLL